VPAEKIVNRMLAKMRFRMHMGAKAGSQAGSQTDIFMSTQFASYDVFASDQHGSQGLQIYDMFASTWLAKESYVPKPHKIIPLLFVGIATLYRVQIGIHMIQFG
jgi:hypothetical protein